MKWEVLSYASAAAFVHISHLWMTVLFLCCLKCGGLLQLYSNVSFESAWAHEPLHKWMQHGQEDNLPPPLHLHRKKTTSSYFRNHFNTWCKWPNSVLKHCYISLQVDQVWATFHPIHADLFLTHSCIPTRSACFPSAYICVNTNPDTHMQAHAYLQSEYCSLSEKRCELIFHGPPLAESQSISQHSHMLDV